MPQSDRMRRWKLTPRGRYWHQKHRAKARGIPWAFTFEEWWAIWQASGKWELRGGRGGCYVMSRIGDRGPYAADNVEIKLFEDNARESGHTRWAGLSDEPAEPVPDVLEL